jgi:PIN domain nuclease of toxin-antitoxin system
VIHLDTNVIVLLHGDQADRIPARSRRLIDEQVVVISPLVELELTCLFEIGRTTQPGPAVVQALEQSLGLSVSAAPFYAVVRAATGLTWTPDPFDRLICGSALADGAPLLTADRTIRANLPGAIWD